MYAYKINYLSAILYVQADKPLDQSDIQCLKDCAADAKAAVMNPNILNVVKHAAHEFKQRTGKTLQIINRPYISAIDI